MITILTTDIIIENLLIAMFLYFFRYKYHLRYYFNNKYLVKYHIYKSSAYNKSYLFFYSQ